MGNSILELSIKKIMIVERNGQKFVLWDNFNSGSFIVVWVSVHFGESRFIINKCYIVMILLHTKVL